MKEQKNMLIKQWKIFFSIAIVSVLAVVIGIVIYNIPDNKIARQLDLGQKYLEDQNYEQALSAFDIAIQIDSMNIEAYWGKAEVYVAMGEFEEAIKILEQGFEKTESNVLLQVLEQYKAGIYVNTISDLENKDGNTIGNNQNTNSDNGNNGNSDFSSNENNSNSEVENSNKRVQSEAHYIEFDWKMDDILIHGIPLVQSDFHSIAPTFGQTNEGFIENWNGLGTLSVWEGDDLGGQEPTISLYDENGGNISYQEGQGGHQINIWDAMLHYNYGDFAVLPFDYGTYEEFATLMKCDEIIEKGKPQEGGFVSEGYGAYTCDVMQNGIIAPLHFSIENPQMRGAGYTGSIWINIPYFGKLYSNGGYMTVMASFESGNLMNIAYQWMPN